MYGAGNMNKKTTINHIALQCSDKEKAEVFFTKVLEMSKVKTFTVPNELSENIFGIKSMIDVEVYDNEVARFEVFIVETSKKTSYEHICIEISNKKEFIARCIKYGIEPMIVKKEGKDLLFLRDFSDNLYEIKEK